jgi:4-hydroxy-2-oxoheptanedioate aldolase
MTLIFCNDTEFAKPRIKEGWDVVAIGTDTGWLTAGAASALAAVGSSS